MKLVSLKNASDGDCMAPCSMAQYGYGLRIYLGDEECEALGITKALRPGTQVTISAKAIVVSSTEELDNDADGGGNEVSVSLQITDMGVEAGAVLRNAADVLYGAAATD
jgi:hypothetical protein